MQNCWDGDATAHAHVGELQQTLNYAPSCALTKQVNDVLFPVVKMLKTDSDLTVLLSKFSGSFIV